MNGEEISTMKDKAYGLIDNGQLAEARECFDQLCETDSSDAEAWLMSGSICGEIGEIENAVSKLNKAIELEPDTVEAYINLGSVLRASDDMRGALENFEKAVDLEPQYLQGWADITAIHGMLGNYNGVVESSRKALEHQPNQPIVMINLGNALLELGEVQAAIDTFKEVVALDPNQTSAWVALTRAYLVTGQYNDAEESSREMLTESPNSAEAYYSLAFSLHAQRKIDDAITQCNELLHHSPDHIDGQILLAMLLAEKGDTAKAKELFHTLQVKLSNDALMLSNLANVLRQLNFYSDATDCLRAITQLTPDQSQSHNDLGAALLYQGKSADAIACFEKAIELDAELKQAYSNLLLSLNYLTEDDYPSLFKKHTDWAEKFYGSGQSYDHPNLVDADRQLKIGYVSPDLRNHPVGHFIEPLFLNHDSQNFSIYCYSDAPQTDEMGERLSSYVSSWVNTSNMSDEDLIYTIKSDGIDILVDLTGHSGKNRLSVFAMKPAPVQVSYLGYPNTTGLKTIDYRITDPRADIEGESQQLYTEKLVFIENGFLAYMPPNNISVDSTSPCEKNNFITFGSFNNLAKVTDDVIKQWATILLAVPNSQFLLKEIALSDDQIKSDLLKRFGDHGVAAERIKLLSWTPTREQHLSTYNEVDIALDTFPYNGTTTTCEAIWMGVPVVTLAGNAHVSRVGASLLGQANLPNLIATSKEQYIDIACKLASNTDELSSMRTSLRAAIEESPICDCVSRTRDIENAYRTMWKNWCSK